MADKADGASLWMDKPFMSLIHQYPKDPPLDLFSEEDPPLGLLFEEDPPLDLVPGKQEASCAKRKAPYKDVPREEFLKITEKICKNLKGIQGAKGINPKIKEDMNPLRTKSHRKNGCQLLFNFYYLFLHFLFFYLFHVIKWRDLSSLCFNLSRPLLGLLFCFLLNLYLLLEKALLIIE